MYNMVLCWLLLGGLSSFAQEPPSGTPDSVKLDQSVLKQATDSSKAPAPAAASRDLFEKLFGQGATIKKDSTRAGGDEITRIGQASGHPERSPKAIHDAAYIYLESIRHCYMRRLEGDPALSGEIMITFDITWKGAVENVRVARSTVADKRLEKCTMGRIKAWKFKEIPAAAGDVTVAYPFRFYP
jgi:TonB family protein